jgi:hypothetical protein
MIAKQMVTETSKQLLDKFHRTPRLTKVEKLVFSGVGKPDVYNITAPFHYDGEEVIVGRVEERNSEFSQVFFFSRSNEVWKPRVHTQTYNLQDPFITFIKGELIFGGVEVITAADNPNKIVSLGYSILSRVPYRFVTSLFVRSRYDEGYSVDSTCRRQDRRFYKTARAQGG